MASAPTNTPARDTLPIEAILSELQTTPSGLGGAEAARRLALYVNLATDGLPALALAVDPPEPDLMRRPPRNARRNIFSRPVVTLMLIGGCWSTMVNLSLFAWASGFGRSSEEAKKEAMTMTLVALVLIEFCKAYVFRSDRHPVWHGPLANKWLNRAILWELTLLCAILYVPFGRTAFGTFPLSWSDWTIAAVVAFSVVPVLELAKWLARRGWLGAME